MFNNLTRTFTWYKHDTLCRTKKHLRISNLKRFPSNNSVYDPYLSYASQWMSCHNRILVFRKDFWDRHGANITTVRGPKKTIKERDHGLFVAVLSELDWVMSIQGKRDFCLNNHEIWGKMHLLTFHHAQGLLRNWHLVLVSKFKHISYKSPKPNNSIKPFQFCLRVLSLLLASSFFLGVVIQKSATTATSKQQEIEMVCLGIEYYRNAFKWLNTYTASLLW